VKRLVLLRHGESVWNAEARIQGQRCAGLSTTGHAQAAASAVALAATHPDARLVTSDLQRTRETVAPLADALAVDVAEDPRLRERSFGAWEGRLRGEVADEDAERWQRWLTGEDVVREVGGESADDLGERVEPVLRELLDDTPDDGVTIAVTHGGPVWHGTHRVLGVPVPTFGAVDNASVTELVAFDGRVVLDRWNEVAHLPVELRTGWRPRARVPAPPVGR
jgi:broad specificity phosphatase PhoE